MAVRLGLAIIAAYILGSIPTSYLAGRWRGIDLREHGSKNLGATNVWRVLGPAFAIPVGLFDVAKGTVAALVLGRLVGPEPWMPLVTGMAAILGHVFTVFLRFKGGKGVATAAGVLLGVAPAATGIAAAVWVGVVVASGYVSAGSILAALAFPIASGLLSENRYVLVTGILLAGFVLFTHRTNIRRLLNGTESRFGRRQRREA